MERTFKSGLLPFSFVLKGFEECCQSRWLDQKNAQVLYLEFEEEPEERD